MAKRKGIKDKKHAGRKPQQTKANKERFLDMLANGYRPNEAADNCKLAPSTVFAWKAKDPAFSEKWENALVLAADKAERFCYQSGIEGNASNLQFWLKGRRGDVFNPWREREQAPPPGATNINITIEEHRERLAKLGVTLDNAAATPLLTYDGDYDDAAPVAAAANGDDSKAD